MCCFSREVESVSNTNIFARAAKGNRQFLVYSMSLQTSEDVAMILPLPTPSKSAEDAIRFINLEKYSGFFSAMRSGFPKPRSATLGLAAGAKRDTKVDTLKVVDVGSFDASFVPTVADFERLDKQFRLDSSVWEKLGNYRDFGFAVFKLKKGKTDVHPMAFEFPRQDAKRLFLPTVHIHDGKVHKTARFDHTLYLQLGDETPALRGWRESPQPAGFFADAKKAKGIINPDAHAYQRILKGRYRNIDVVI